MENLTREELIDITVALDNEALRDDVRSEALRDLMWKIFAIMDKLDKQEG